MGGYTRKPQKFTHGLKAWMDVIIVIAYSYRGLCDDISDKLAVMSFTTLDDAIQAITQVEVVLNHPDFSSLSWKKLTPFVPTRVIAPGGTTATTMSTQPTLTKPLQCFSF